MSTPISPYRAAAQRRAQAVETLLAAQKARDEASANLTEAEAEWADATHEMRRFAIDPEYRGPRRKQVSA
jgi:hypothetical protein